MELFGFSFSAPQLAVLIFCAFAAGFSKTGIIGMGIIITPLTAGVFPAGTALGFMIPLYLMGDIAALSIFRRAIMWRPLLKALPWGIFGTLAGWQITGFINARFGADAEGHLRTLIGVLMAAVVALSHYVSRHPEIAMARPRDADAPNPGGVKLWYAAGLGTLAGLISMITNSGGPIWAMYLSSLGLGVKEVIGTAVWCFFVVTVLKAPLSANLGFLNINTVKLDLVLFPLTLAGVLIGAKVSGRYSKKTFNRIIQILAALGSLYMIFS